LSGGLRLTKSAAARSIETYWVCSRLILHNPVLREFDHASDTPPRAVGPALKSSAGDAILKA